MTVTQSVDIPVSRKLIINVPPEVPTGPAVISFTSAGEVAAQQGRARVFGCAKGQFRMADDFDAPLEEFKDYM